MYWWLLKVIVMALLSLKVSSLDEYIRQKFQIIQNKCSYRIENVAIWVPFFFPDAQRQIMRHMEGLARNTCKYSRAKFLAMMRLYWGIIPIMSSKYRYEYWQPVETCLMKTCLSLCLMITKSYWYCIPKLSRCWLKEQQHSENSKHIR